MNPRFVKIAHQLLFWFMTAVAITGIFKVFNYDGEVLNIIHRSCGVILVLLFLLHMHIHADMLKHVVFGRNK